MTTTPRDEQTVEDAKDALRASIMRYANLFDVGEPESEEFNAAEQEISAALDRLLAVVRAEQDLQIRRILELLAIHDIGDPDVLKHTLEDHDRWKKNVVEQDIQIVALTTERDQLDSEVLSLKASDALSFAQIQQLRNRAEAAEDESTEPRLNGDEHYDASLDVAIERGALVIHIGIQRLAHAVTYSDWANPYDESTGDYIRTFAITDALQFAKDVASAMQDEREDGSSPLTDFLDKMSEEAINQGSLGLHEDFNHRIKHGEKSPLETW